jgi:solute carrier family 25 (adenine nucleotide translocator) protein 4/5/6/31
MAVDMKSFLIDFTLGGVSGAVAKTLTAPIERIKLVIQTQDANPKIRSGEVPRYTGIMNCGSRIYNEQGLKRFWDGNFTNCIRYFPTQAFNLAFKDTFKKMFPKYNPKTEFMQFFGANLVSGGLAAAGSLTIVYPLDYSRTRLASDVGSGKKTFSGLGDCMMKTAQGPGGFMALYTGFGVSVIGIVGYRGL